MYVSIEQVKIGAMNFVENEIASKAVGFQKFATYFAMPIIGSKIEAYANSFKENVFAKDFFDEYGKVNLDELYNMSKQSIRKSGQFSVYSVILGESDIDSIYNYIRNAIA
jgi:hypothetical protein